MTALEQALLALEDLISIYSTETIQAGRRHLCLIHYPRCQDTHVVTSEEPLSPLGALIGADRRKSLPGVLSQHLLQWLPKTVCGQHELEESARATLSLLEEAASLLNFVNQQVNTDPINHSKSKFRQDLEELFHRI